MNFLLDTHVFAWWVLDSPRLSKVARQEIGNREHSVFVSAVSALEMATKHRLGKWDGIAELLDAIDDVVRAEGFEQLPVRMAHARLAGAFPVEHRDPFDRLLAAQSLSESMTLISADTIFHEFDVKVVF